MKTSITEYEHTFYIEFHPETLEDAIFLVRMKLNVTKERMVFDTTVFEDLKMYSYLSLSKRSVSFTGIDKGKP